MTTPAHRRRCTVPPLPRQLNVDTPPLQRSTDWLGVCVDLSAKSCLIVGGGRVAVRRYRTLESVGAKIRVVAPEIDADIRAGGASCRLGVFEESDLDDCDLVVVATSDEALNLRIARLARQRKIWVNAAFNSGEGDLIFPVTVQRGDLNISVSSSARAPALSRYVAAEIGARYGPRWAVVADFAGRWRDKVKQTLGAREGREKRKKQKKVDAFWHQLLRGVFVEMILSGQRDRAEGYLRAQLADAAHGNSADGSVYLVGAGPGDQGLLTLRAFDLLHSADAVLYDRLVSAQVLACIPGHVELINVGKESQRPSLGQKPINELMVEMARAGRRVVRLKGGDPFIFGRGGEEIAELAASGIPFQVIPGISAANGCASYAGIPLTHRDYAHSCVLLTAHRHQEAGEIDWAALNRPMQTIVLYMGNYRLAEVARRLMENGFVGTHPLALISCGTTDDEKIWTGTLDEVIQCPPQLPSPALAIVGEVVRLRRYLNWRPVQAPGST